MEGDVGGCFGAFSKHERHLLAVECTKADVHGGVCICQGVVESEEALHSLHSGQMPLSRVANNCINNTYDPPSICHARHKW
jgi:hypothetical protein